MKTRILAAVVLVPMLLAVLFFAPPIVLAVLLGVVCAIGAYELMFGTLLVKFRRMYCYTALVAFGMALWCYFGMPRAYGMAAVFLYTVAVFAEILHSKGKIPFEEVAVGFVAGFLIPYLLSALVRIMGDGSNRGIILIPFILAFMSDTGAYFIGSAFGKHKLAPTISPKKSVEGLFGGIAFSILSMVVFGLIMDLGFHFRVNYLYAVTYGLIGALAGTFGDLCFSAIKRQAGIKDYGNLIPGHGGVLDRFDSVIIAAPLTELLLILMPILE